MEEFTEPWKTNIPKQHMYKQNMHEELRAATHTKMNSYHFYTVEFGTKGLPGKPSK